MFRRFLDSALPFTAAVIVAMGPIYAPAVLDAASPPPVVQSPCSTKTSPEAIVACEQARAGGAAAMHEGAPNYRGVTLTILRQTAASLNAAGIPGGPFGVLVKTGGENCDGYSCDIICAGNGSSQRQWDVFSAVHQESKPGWGGPLATITVRPCEFVAGVPPVPVPSPTPEPIDLKPILNRIAALEQQLGDLRAQDADLRALLAASDADLRKVIAALPVGAVPCDKLPLYRGSGWFGSITSRAVCR